MSSNGVVEQCEVRWTRFESDGFEQVPEIAVEIFEDGHSTVALIFRFPDEGNFQGYHGVVISPEVVRLQEEKYSAACLIADKLFLLQTSGPRQEKIGTTTSRWRDDYPTLVLFWLVGIVNERKIELAAVELNRFVIVTNDQRSMQN